VKLLAGPLQKATAAAASLTGKRFSLLVASSLVATTGVVAVGLANSSGISQLEAAAAKALLEKEVGAVAPTSATPEPATAAPTPEASSGGEAAAGGPLPTSTAAPETAPAPEPEAPPARRCPISRASCAGRGCC
jgi:hypothetical protein